jgi:hypothetical protein
MVQYIVCPPLGSKLRVSAIKLSSLAPQNCPQSHKKPLLQALEIL